MDDQPAWSKGNLAIPPERVRPVAQQAVDVALLSQKPDGQIGGIGWWQNANAYTAIALLDLWSGSNTNYETLARALRQCERQHSGFLENAFNDDVLWWGICCIHVFDIGRDRWFLDKAKEVWMHVRHSGSICGQGQAQFRGVDMEGACYWTTNRGEQQVNAITTGLFAELGLRLVPYAEEVAGHSRSLKKLFKKSPVGKDEYEQAASCSLRWILRCRYREAEAIVLDHILLKDQQAVDWTFTYTTGVAIGVCALLFEATGEMSHLSLACNMARQAMRRGDWVEDDGVLTERGAYGKGTHDPAQNNDAVGFKAVLVRHLGTLYSTIVRCGKSTPEAEAVMSLIRSFINVNFQSQQDRNTNSQGQYGPWWNGPFEMPTSHSQMAALDVMAAAVLVN